MDISLHRGPVGDSGGGSFFKVKENAYLGSFFLDPEDIES